MSSDIIQMLSVVVWMQERFSSDQSSMTDSRPVFAGFRLETTAEEPWLLTDCYVSLV